MTQLLKWHLEIDRYLEEAGRLLVTCEGMRLSADLGKDDTCSYMEIMKDSYLSTRRRVHMAFVRVLDETGNEVQRFAIDPSDQALRWTGAGDDGQPLPDGNYSFEVESWSNGKVLATYPADVYTRITEARGGSNGMMLIAAGGVEFLSSQVISLREPS